MILQQLRDFTRAQLDVDEEELPNALLDTYLQEGFTRTMSMEGRWPFYEASWTLTDVDGDGTIPIPTDCNPQMIMSLLDAANGRPLQQISNELAETRFIGTPTATAPSCYSIYGGLILLWPRVADDPRSYLVRGYRHPADWITGGASAEPDCDVRLHQLLAHYAIALFYAQEEDEVLEDTYMKRWQSLFIPAHASICAPRHHRPLVFNVGVVGQRANPVAWANPPVAP